MEHINMTKLAIMREVCACTRYASETVVSHSFLLGHEY